MSREDIISWDTQCDQVLWSKEEEHTEKYSKERASEIERRVLKTIKDRQE